jgi:hypothetical protein
MPTSKQMLVSEFIERLQALLAEHGDLPVRIESGRRNPRPTLTPSGWDKEQIIDLKTARAEALNALRSGYRKLGPISRPARSCTQGISERWRSKVAFQRHIVCSLP